MRSYQIQDVKNFRQYIEDNVHELNLDTINFDDLYHWLTVNKISPKSVSSIRFAAQVMSYLNGNID